ncbi:MAG: hypothetical protein ABJQ23_16770 [Shimia thalassica]|uniref:calcium-binding protein n=1 Tax=Shimia thalassica TaxID=1715693 RepID=UPI00329A0EEF
MWKVQFLLGSGISMAGQIIPLGNPFQVNSLTSGDQSTGLVARASETEFLVTWTSYESSGTNLEVFGQRYDLNGSSIGANFQISPSDLDAREFNISLSHFAPGGVVAIWAGRPFPDDDVLRSLTIGNDGSQPWSMVEIDYDGRSWSNGIFRSLSDGSFVRQYNEFPNVFLQRYDAEGNIVGSPTTVSSEWGEVLGGDLSVSRRNDDMFVLWIENKSLPFGQQEASIQGQLFTRDGDLIGPQIQVSNTDSNMDTFDGDLSAVVLDSGNVAASWSENSTIFYGLFGTNGEPITRLAILGEGSTSQVSSSLHPLLDGRSLLSLSDTDGSTLHLFDSNGNQVGDPYQLRADISLRNLYFTSLSELEQNRLVAVFEDFDADGTGVFAQLLAINTAPEGNVLITGTPTQGRTLIADASGVTDADGIDATTITYQWLRDGMAIEGATDQRYQLTQADVGEGISAVFSYTDEIGIDENVISDASAPVENVNDAAEGDVLVMGTSTQGEAMIADVSGVTDADGIDASTITYQWLRDGVAIAGATNHSYQLTQADVGGGISVVFTYTDDFGTEENVISGVSAPVENVNDAAEGDVLITGTVIQGETLLADASGVTDADGIVTTTISYQWLRDGVAIAGATNHSYQLTQTDVGGGISVVLTYTDDFGTEENVVSDVTAPVDPLGMNLTGTPGNDDLSGNLSDDTIYGLDGDDRLIGDLGNDSLFAGDGNDTINGGEGNDTIFGGETTEDIRDIIYAGAGNDRVEAGFGNDLVFGMDGDDVIAGGFGADELQGQNGNDVITGSAFGDLIFGGDGDDFINGGYGFDLKNGGSGADRFYHEGDVGHGSDWVQDYMAAEGDILLFGFDFAEGSNFQVNFAHTENATGERSGDDSIMEAFVIFRPTSQIIWALVDGAGQAEINLRVSGSSEMFDLLG